MFIRYSLRTTDTAAAHAFYREALGLTLPDGMVDDSVLELWPLHERAIARGAPPHWLGHLAVDDVAAAIERLTAHGSEAMGPIVQARDGANYAVLREPSGAVISVRERNRMTTGAPVVWHQLHTRDVDAAWKLYHELFGWTLRQTLDVPDLVGGYRMFAWSDAGPAIGAMGNTARWPGVHTHWCFYFPVADVDATRARVRACGGKALPAITLPSGIRLSACDDPQGAAFGLIQRQ
jgi:predicted enzyme related to lactoylglutathione lyase